MKTLRTLLLLTLFFTLSCFTKAEAANYRLLPNDGISAYHLGIGNIDGFGSTPQSVFENPASLHNGRGTQIAAFTTDYVGGLVNVFNTALATDFFKGRIGIGFMSQISDPSPDTRGLPIGVEPTKFHNYSDRMTSLAYQQNISKNISFGLAYVVYSKEIAEVRAKAHNANLGVTWTKNKWATSLYFRNILASNMVYNNGSIENIPFQATGGLQYQWQNILFLSQIKIENDVILPSIGFIYQPDWLNNVKFTSGLREQLINDESRTKWTLGVNLDLYGLNFYYAYEKIDFIEASNQHYLSVQLNFDTLKQHNKEISQ